MRFAFTTNTRQSFQSSTRSAGEKASRRGENAWACRTALGLKKLACADHHDVQLQEKRRLGNADADSTRGHGQMLLSSTGLRRHQQQMQEHIDLLLVHDAIDYARV